MEPEGIAAEVQTIVDAESDDVEKMVASLNESMRNMWCIEWIGQFRDLCEGEASSLLRSELRSEGGEAVPAGDDG